MIEPSPHTRIANRLLARLPLPVYDCLKAHLQRVPLRAGQWLFHAHDPIDALHFPESGVVSLVVTLRSGEALDVGIVGNDGIAGSSAVGPAAMQPCDGVVQTEGIAQRIEAELLRRQMATNEPIFNMLSAYTRLVQVQHMQSAACIAFHSVRERSARWLLATHDLVGRDELPLTHDRLARLLGVRRVSVTLVLGALEAVRLISHTRGRVVIRNREGLERASCECYRTMRDERLRLLGF